MIHDIEKLKYPIGKFKAPSNFDEDFIQKCIDEIEGLPYLVRKAVSNLSDKQLDTPYRPEGWTIRQVVHHLVDSHIHAFCRIRYALTEENPIVKPYPEHLWAVLPDAALPVMPSLEILSGLHCRFAYMLRPLHHTERERTLIHPEYTNLFSVNTLIAMYAWHGKHHLGHILQVF